MSKKINFTVAKLAAIKAPAAGRIFVYDQKTPGLTLCVMSTGKRVFYLYRRINGKPVRVRLGAYPPLTIEQARKAADRVNGDIAGGKDPQEERQQARGGPTLGEAFEHLKENRIKVRGRTSTLMTDRSRFETCLGDWRDRKLKSITRAEVVARHIKLAKERGKTTANRAVQLLRRIYNHAEKPFNLVGLVNPASRIELFPEVPRERFLQVNELPPFFRALEKEPEDFRDFFYLCLWTGARRGNVQRMRWADVNLEAALWIIPAEEFKTGRPLSLPLAPEAVAILRRRHTRVISEYVFPGRGRTRHLVEPKGSWDRVRQEAGLADVRIHDLRRTLGSWQAGLGTSLHIVGRSLGHKRPETTAIYARLNLDPVRASVDAATKAIGEAAKGKVQDGNA